MIPFTKGYRTRIYYSDECDGSLARCHLCSSRNGYKDTWILMIRSSRGREAYAVSRIQSSVLQGGKNCKSMCIDFVPYLVITV